MSATYTRIRRYGAMVAGSVCAWGLAITGLGLSRWLWLAVSFLALGGAALFILAVFRGTILQAAATDEMRGRMQGISPSRSLCRPPQPHHAATQGIQCVKLA